MVYKEMFIPGPIPWDNRRRLRSRAKTLYFSELYLIQTATYRTHCILPATALYCGSFLPVFTVGPISSMHMDISHTVYHADTRTILGLILYIVFGIFLLKKSAQAFWFWYSVQALFRTMKILDPILLTTPNTKYMEIPTTPVRRFDF